MHPNDPIFWPMAAHHRDLRGHLCWCRSYGHEALSSFGCRRQSMSRTSSGSAARALVIVSNTTVASLSPIPRWEFAMLGCAVEGSVDGACYSMGSAGPAGG